ncbi:MAG TPA: metallopeptidase TldD-related protein [Candidatus Binataceae bacterium]|nr:metallopeptidase TldD-related protein [Candidatus Binataceae bacterium]
MHSLTELKSFARQAGAALAREKDLAAYEVYCSAGEHRVARLNYTSDIPSRGIEEFKSLNADGFAIRVVMRRDPHETGSAAIAGDLSLASLREALGRARRAAIVDPHFPGLPNEPVRLAKPQSQPEPSDLLRAKDNRLAAAAWEIIGAAIAEFDKRAPLKLAHPGLVVGGDLSLIRDRVAICSSAFEDIRVDESAHFVASVTVLIEGFDAKGTATAIGGSVAEMETASARLGREAVMRALELRHGEHPDAGEYRVLFGPQPLAEILNYMVVPSLTTGAFHAASSAYLGRFGAEDMDARLSLANDPFARQSPVRRGLTCEGLPAGRTELIRDGRLVGLLSTFYDSHRLLTDEHRGEKLGPAAVDLKLAFPPHSGYRLGESPARRFDSHPGASGTSVIVRARDGVDEKGLLAAIGDGLYVGRVWYTYPINGQRAGDFTCTVSGDSYVIRGGKLAAPLAPNCLRINANLSQVFGNPLALGKKPESAVVWGAPEAYFTPSIAAQRIALSAVGAVDSD